MSTTAPTLIRAPLPRQGGQAAIALTGAAVAAGLAAALLGPVALALPVAALLVAWLVRHPQALLVTFVSIGVFKGTPLLDLLPADPTLALGLLLVGVCVARVLNGRALKVSALYALTFVVIGLLLAISLLYTLEPAYGAEKVLKFWTFTAVAGFAPFCVVEDERDLRALLRWLLVAAVVGALVTMAFGQVTAANDVNNANDGRLEFGGIANTIFMSRMLCLGVIVAFFAPVMGLGGRWRTLLPLLGVFLAAVAAFIGSRGPIVALVLAFAFTLAGVVVRNPRVLRYLLVLLVLAVAAFSFVKLPETSAARLTGVATNPAAVFEGDGRATLYRQAIEIIAAHPLFGLGSGSFLIYSAVVSVKDIYYPHNIFLEVAADVGLPAALLLAGMLGALVVGLFRRGLAEDDQTRRMLAYAVLALLLCTLFAAQFSGDINDNRTLWTTLGLGWLVVRHGIPSTVAATDRRDRRTDR
jgi:O-antigen ligase